MLLIIGPNGSGQQIVLASHSEESLPEVITASDAGEYYSGVTKVLFVKEFNSNFDREGSATEILDPEPSFTPEQIRYDRFRKVYRRILRRQVLAIMDGQTGVEDFQWTATVVGEKLKGNVLFDFPVPEVDRTVSISNTQFTNCKSFVVLGQRDTGFRFELTSIAKGLCKVRFNWAVALS